MQLERQFFNPVKTRELSVVWLSEDRQGSLQAAFSIVGTQFPRGDPGEETWGVVLSVTALTEAGTGRWLCKLTDTKSF